MSTEITLFENFSIRRLYNEKAGKWYFSVVDIVQVLLQQSDFQASRKYWNKLKERLRKEGSQAVTNCHQLKMRATEFGLRKGRAEIHGDIVSPINEKWGVDIE
ncbi:MAG: hypothetical protein A2268_10860 [Candidatus Raymondbacteria bacterium RifOxyA12_full_50_37]|nr:MAG: hypothetical protein A2268_10860 [Candidatus Raymondbacteria bacterium RifOxyA12_full_50_37]OGJ85462.1 MAG: hypothetical protein A2248_12645 [Candidatus Raymondbacteria bacterium RIFOXYA2_FULL_49_16]OGJ94970.1 MAG: hypothetical protein A2453_08115 [Candidatus Raymondbacteria bacterium RIFOXYC2_FULL_50_21]OGK01885.1 MAG: hypothetical protein A2487_11730 [Candidatus Raymondbacteria bacterium RifOxyC12_full_50_8]OGP45602.1 MAG: hypothetical protein A2324_04505 [Candidatus Raymondbacteria b